MKATLQSKCFQVLNKYGNPASNDHDDLCIFPSRAKADSYIDYLVSELEIEETFTVKPVTVIT